MTLHSPLTEILATANADHIKRTQDFTSRMGRFVFSTEVLKTEGDRLLPFFAQVVPINILHRYPTPFHGSFEVEYLAYSWLFDPITPGELAPHYRIIVHTAPSSIGLDRHFEAERLSPQTQSANPVRA